MYNDIKYMSIPSFKNILTIILIIFILSVAASSFAQYQASDNKFDSGYYIESPGAPATVVPAVAAPEYKKKAAVSKKKKGTLETWDNLNLSELQSQARAYRAQGAQLQQHGDLDGAMSLYQKAIELDPAYAVAYNDLGVILEAKGFTDRAEESYLKAAKIDPGYLSAYTNLALLYQNKRELDKAAVYWKKRAELGSPDDPWTEKARQRLEDIRFALSDNPIEDFKEQEAIGLLKDVANEKSLLKKDNKELAKFHFKRAKQSYSKGDEVAAFKEAVDASQLDPSNTEIEEFIDKLERRLLSR